MIAVCVNQSVEEFFGGVRYNRNIAEHRALMDECALLQWPARQAWQHIQDNGYYYCAVYNKQNVEVYEMDRNQPFITMAVAQDRGLITYENNLWKIYGFQTRSIGVLDNGNESLGLERKYFLNSRRAPDNIVNLWLDDQHRFYRFYGGSVGYIKTPEYQ